MMVMDKGERAVNHGMDSFLTLVCVTLAEAKRGRNGSLLYRAALLFFVHQRNNIGTEMIFIFLD